MFNHFYWNYSIRHKVLILFKTTSFFYSGNFPSAIFSFSLSFHRPFFPRSLFPDTGIHWPLVLENFTECVACTSCHSESYEELLLQSEGELDQFIIQEIWLPGKKIRL